MQVQSQLVFCDLKHNFMKSEFQNSDKELSHLSRFLGETLTTELAWYLLQALLFSRPCAERALTSLSSQKWA